MAKGLLPYPGLGSGIKRALEQWPGIEFVDDYEGCLFTATVKRNIQKLKQQNCIHRVGSKKTGHWEIVE